MKHEELTHAVAWLVNGRPGVPGFMTWKTLVVTGAMRVLKMGRGRNTGGEYKRVISKAAEGGEVMVMFMSMPPGCIRIYLCPCLSGRVSLCLFLSLCVRYVSVSVCQISPTVQTVYRLPHLDLHLAISIPYQVLQAWGSIP